MAIPVDPNGQGGNNRAVILYFDSSVYGFIDATHEASDVASWLKQGGHRLVASVEANVGEALRIPNEGQRVSRIQAITTVEHGPPVRSIDVASAEEFLAEVVAHRRGWLRRMPSTSSRTAYQRRLRQQWLRLRRDPSFMPAGAQTMLPMLHEAFGKNVDIQRQRRDIVRAGADIPPLTDDSDLQRHIASMDWQERHVRYQLSGEWYYQLKKPTTATAAADWLLPHLDLARMFPPSEAGEDDWFRFWFRDARLKNMPHEWIGALTEHFQLMRKIDVGNSVDRIHACYLLQVDALVTADRDFYAVLKDVRRWIPYTRGSNPDQPNARGSPSKELKSIPL